MMLAIKSGPQIAAKVGNPAGLLCWRIWYSVVKSGVLGITEYRQGRPLLGQVTHNQCMIKACRSRFKHHLYHLQPVSGSSHRQPMHDQGLWKQVQTSLIPSTTSIWVKSHTTNAWSRPLEAGSNITYTIYNQYLGQVTDNQCMIKAFRSGFKHHSYHLQPVSGSSHRQPMYDQGL